MEIAQTADHALQVVLLLRSDDDGQTTKELAAQVGVSASVMARTLFTLNQRAAVIRDLKGRYWLGPLFISLAQGVQHGLSILSKPVLEGIAERFDETAILAVQDGDDAVIVAREGGTSGTLRVELQPGFRQPLNLGASSLALLAYSEEEQIVRLLGAEGIDRMRMIRAAGFAESEGSVNEGMIGVAVPIVTDGRVLGALGVVAPAIRRQKLYDVVPVLKEAGAQIASEARLAGESA